MNPNESEKSTGGGTPQNSHNADASGISLLKTLEPSLWNSSLGRRTFLKRAGAATIGTAVVLHGFRTEVLASGSNDVEYFLVCISSPTVIAPATYAKDSDQADGGAHVGELQGSGPTRGDIKSGAFQLEGTMFGERWTTVNPARQSQSRAVASQTVTMVGGNPGTRPTVGYSPNPANDSDHANPDTDNQSRIVISSGSMSGISILNTADIGQFTITVLGGLIQWTAPQGVTATTVQCDLQWGFQVMTYAEYQAFCTSLGITPQPKP